MYDVVLSFCASLDQQSIVPAQLPLLLEFLCSYHNNAQLDALKRGDAKDAAVPAFVAAVPDVGDDLQASIDSVYLLTYALHFQALPPLPYLKRAVLIAGRAWDPASEREVVETFRRCTRKLDLQLLGLLEQRAARDKLPMLQLDISQLALNEDDRARFYALSSFSDREVRLRLALFQFYNAQLNRVVHLVELGASKYVHADTLGLYLGLLTGYIFPSVKEN